MKQINPLEAFQNEYRIAYLWANHPDGHIVFVQLGETPNRVPPDYVIDFEGSISKYYESQGIDARSMISLNPSYDWKVTWIDAKTMLWVPFAEMVNAPDDGHTEETLVEGRFIDVETLRQMINSNKWYVILLDSNGRRVTLANPVVTMNAGQSLINDEAE